MYFNPILDLSRLTDEDLLKKIDELQKKLVITHQMGVGEEVIRNIQTTIDLYRSEYSERQASRNAEERDKAMAESTIIGEEDNTPLRELPKRKLWK